MSKVSFNQIDKIIKATKEEPQVFSYDCGNGEVVDIEIKRFVSVDNMDSFVNSVADAVFVEGVYKPALVDIVFFKAELAYFTNIKTEGLSNERLIGLYEALSYDVATRIDPRIREQLYDAVEARIKWTLDCALSAQKRRLDDAIAELNAEKDMISERMDAILSVFERLSSEVKDFDKEALMRDIQTIAGKDESAIANAVLDRQRAEVAHIEPEARA